MVGRLLMRGMLAGILAGLLCFGFLRAFGEPQVDRAIAFESQVAEAKAKAEIQAALAKGLPAPHEEVEPDLVSRPVQAGIGLFTGVTVYSAAFGGLFALAFAFAQGRMAGTGPRATAALLAAGGFVALYLVPNLKYPANPPAIGEPETIGIRTALYFGMMAISLAALVGSATLRRRLAGQVGAWNAAVLAAACYLAVVSAAAALLPAIDEVPPAFPATLLWHFRIASIGSQALMWATIGLAFGALIQREASHHGSALVRAAA